MGVDITLYLEIKRQEQWHRLSLASPMTVHGEDGSGCPSGYTCRYYHFEQLISEAPPHVRNDMSVLSEEARSDLEKEKPGSNLGFGVFLFEDLDRYCESLEKAMLRVMARSELFVIKGQLDRIEDLLLDSGKSKESLENRPDREQTCLESLEEAYEGFMCGTDGVVLEYWRSVRALPLIVPGLDPDSLRIFYEIW